MESRLRAASVVAECEVKTEGEKCCLNSNNPYGGEDKCAHKLVMLDILVSGKKAHACFFLGEAALGYAIGKIYMTLKISKNWLCPVLSLYCVKSQNPAQFFMYSVYSNV